MKNEIKKKFYTHILKSINEFRHYKILKTILCRWGDFLHSWFNDTTYGKISSDSQSY